MARYYTIAPVETQLREVERALGAVSRDVDKILRGAVKDTAKQLRTRISNKIREQVVIKKKDVDQYIRIFEYQGAAQARVSISESARVPLKYFAARQNRVGVTYKIKKAEARQTVPSGFIVDKLGGHVFKRITGSKRRQPGGRYQGQLREKITRLHGPSPWAVFQAAGLEADALQACGELLSKNIDRRVNLVLLRLAGKVKTPGYEAKEPADV